MNCVVEGGDGDWAAGSLPQQILFKTTNRTDNIFLCVSQVLHLLLHSHSNIYYFLILCLGEVISQFLVEVAALTNITNVKIEYFTQAALDSI